jgi:hypothetical protein
MLEELLKCLTGNSFCQHYLKVSVQDTLISLAILKLSVQNTALCFLFKINSCTSLIYFSRKIICKTHTKVCLAGDETGQAGKENIILNVLFASSDFLRLWFCINRMIQRGPSRILELTL